MKYILKCDYCGKKTKGLNSVCNSCHKKLISASYKPKLPEMEWSYKLNMFVIKKK